MERDRIKWDSKYLQKPNLLNRKEVSFIVKKYFSLAPNKLALDIAAGGGRHTLFLEKQGFRVDAVDISKVATKALKEKVNSSRVNVVEADLDSYEFKKEYYGLILKINYLDREVIRRAQDSLVRGGLFIIEGYLDDKINQKPSNPNFLLKRGELKELFDDSFEIIEYIEFENEPYEIYRMKKAAIVVRKR
ncbi:MAG: methyltransferase domain-containing protein [Epsilonproteobacteria bacterium]|nr:methyltransferase domain-containing protein [Campylobacterota bacterium]